MTLKEILFGGGSALFVLLTLLQLAPIKINPWSAIPSNDAKGVLQLAYGGERGFLFALRPLSFAECTEMISKDQQSVNLTARVFVRPCRPCCIAATFASYHGRDISGRESVEIFLRHFRQIAAA